MTSTSLQGPLKSSLNSQSRGVRVSVLFVLEVYDELLSPRLDPEEKNSGINIGNFLSRHYSLFHFDNLYKSPEAATAQQYSFYSKQEIIDQPGSQHILCIHKYFLTS